MKCGARGVRFLALLASTACWGERNVGERAQPAEWTSEPTIRAGEVDGPGALADVFNVAIGPRQTIMVAQSTVSTIAVFDVEGDFVRTVGRAGPGPGEFDVLGRIGWTGDTLWVVDYGKVHLFDAALEFVRTLAPPMPEAPRGVARMIPGSLLADGSILGIPFSFGGAAREPVMLLSQTGSVRRVLAYVSTQGRSLDVDLGRGRPVSVADPWPDFPLWMSAADGRSIIVVHRRAAAESSRAEFRIVRIGLDSDTLVNTTHSYTPVPLDEADRDSVYRMLAERYAPTRRVSVTAAEEDIRDRLLAPPFHPPVSDLLAGRDGTIWLRRGRTRADSVVWQVFDERGEVLGRVRLPAALDVEVAEVGRIWGVVTDSLDVPYIQVYEIGGLL